MIAEDHASRDRSNQQDWNAYGDSEVESSEDEDPIPRFQQNLPRPAPQEPIPPPLPTTFNISWIGHIFQPFSDFGPSVFSWDAWKSCIWDLFTHAGFFTYVHHDAAGFATYAFVRDSCKIWGIHRPKVSPSDDTRHKIFDIMRRILCPHMMLDYIQHTDLYNIFLLKGDVL